MKWWLKIILIIFMWACNKNDDSAQKAKLIDQLTAFEIDVPSQYKRKNVVFNYEKSGEVASISLFDFQNLYLPNDLLEGFSFLTELYFENCSFSNSEIALNSLKRVQFRNCSRFNPISIVKNCSNLEFLAIVSNNDSIPKLSLNELPDSVDTLYLQSNNIKRVRLDRNHPLKILVLHEPNLLDREFIKMLDRVDTVNSVL